MGSVNKDQVKDFEKKLLEKRKAIAAAARESRLPADTNSDYGRDEGDRATASQAKEMDWIQASQERGLLQLVEAALARVHEGGFGECQNCGQEIGLKRLSAIPWTRYCITCQELIEQQR